MGMKVDKFHGIVPKMVSEKLPNGYASYAENCHFHSGAIVPMNAPAATGHVMNTCGSRFIGSPKAIHKLGDDLWIGFDKFVRPAEDPLKSFGRDSILFVQDGKLYRTSSSRVLTQQCPVEVGICPPKSAPMAAAVGTCDGINVDPMCYESEISTLRDKWHQEAVEQAEATGAPIPVKDVECTSNELPPVAHAFCYTWVTGCEEESAPSPFSEPIFVPENSQVVITTGENAPANAVKIRWYRLISSKEGASMLLIGETPAATTALTHCLNWYSGNDTLISEGWFPIPACAEGIVNIGQRSVMAWGGRELYPSEAGQPHAFPEIYRMTVDDSIVAALSYLDGKGSHVAIILTEGACYRVDEVSPNKYNITRLIQHLPAVSQAATLVDANTVLYMTPYGMAAVGANGPSIITSKWFDEYSWRKLSPQNYLIGFHDHRVYAISSVEDSPSFVFSLGDSNPYDPDDLVYLSIKATAVYQDDRTKLSYSGAFSGGDSVYEIEKSNQPMRAVWRSRFNIVGPLWSPNCAYLWVDEIRIPTEVKSWLEAAANHYDRIPLPNQIESFVRKHPKAKLLTTYAPQPTVRFTVYGLYEQRYSRMVWSTKPFRVPRKGRHREWHVQVETTTPVYQIAISDSIDTLSARG